MRALLERAERSGLGGQPSLAAAAAEAAALAESQELLELRLGDYGGIAACRVSPFLLMGGERGRAESQGGLWGHRGMRGEAMQGGGQAAAARLGGAGTGWGPESR